MAGGGRRSFYWRELRRTAGGGLSGYLLDRYNMALIGIV